ncbi:MAG TPA: ATPase [Bacteroidales bacterium]|nr:ATPase [Bacteroidales bacterium]
MVAIDIQNLSKSFPKVQALNKVSFKVDEAELFGLIGPDGAGKTTLFRLLTSLYLPDSGKLEIFGQDVVESYVEIRKHLGYMPGKFSLYQDLSVEENLKFFAAVFGTKIEDNYELIADIYKMLEPFKKRRAGKLSGGMKQKLALSCALIHRPKILLLDEPTTGVDAVSRKEFWEMLKRLKSFGITILVSTPYMDEASLCDRVALIKDGSILQCDTPVRIPLAFSSVLFGLKSKRMYELVSFLRKQSVAKSAYLFGQEIHFASNNPNLTIAELLEILQNNGFEDAECEIIEPTIEDRFMELI